MQYNLSPTELTPSLDRLRMRVTRKELAYLATLLTTKGDITDPSTISILCKIHKAYPSIEGNIKELLKEINYLDEKLGSQAYALVMLRQDLITPLLLELAASYALANNKQLPLVLLP